MPRTNVRYDQNTDSHKRTFHSTKFGVADEKRGEGEASTSQKAETLRGTAKGNKSAQVRRQTFEGDRKGDRFICEKMHVGVVLKTQGLLKQQVFCFENTVF